MNEPEPHKNLPRHKEMLNSWSQISGNLFKVVSDSSVSKQDLLEIFKFAEICDRYLNDHLDKYNQCLIANLESKGEYEKARLRKNNPTGDGYWDFKSLQLINEQRATLIINDVPNYEALDSLSTIIRRSPTAIYHKLINTKNKEQS